MGKINLNPPEEYLEAEQLGALIDLWLAEISVDPKTHRSYRDRVRYFRLWWEDVGPGVEWRLTPSLCRAFEMHLRNRVGRLGTPLTYYTRKLTIRVVRQMLFWALTTGKTPKNYGLWLPFPAGEPPKRKAAKPEQLAKLMLSAAESPKALRDQTLIAFMIGTGCRRGEVAGLKAEDLEILADGSGTAIVTGKRTKANRTGVRVVGFSASTGKWLVRYLDATGIERGPMWPVGIWRHLTAQGVYQVVKRAIGRAGLDDVIQGPHDLRRAFATILGKIHRDSPAWSDLIQRQLGHKQYAQTRDYILLDADDIRDQIIDPLDL